MSMIKHWWARNRPSQSSSWSNTPLSNTSKILLPAINIHQSFCFRLISGASLTASLSSFMFSFFFIPSLPQYSHSHLSLHLSLPWLATVQMCPLELREGQGSRSLLPTNTEWGSPKASVCWSPTHMILLIFNSREWDWNGNALVYNSVLCHFWVWLIEFSSHHWYFSLLFCISNNLWLSIRHEFYLVWY